MDLVINKLEKSQFPETFEWDDVVEQFVVRLRNMVRSDAIFTREEEFETLLACIDAAVGEYEFVAAPRRAWYINQAALQIATWLNSLPQWPQTSRPKFGQS